MSFSHVLLGFVLIVNLKSSLYIYEINSLSVIQVANIFFSIFILLLIWSMYLSVYINVVEFIIPFLYYFWNWIKEFSISQVTKEFTKELTPRNANAGLYGKFIFCFVRKCQTVYQSNFAILHPYQQWKRVPVALLAIIFYLLALFSSVDFCFMDFVSC